mgnify:FL=1
MSEPRVLYLPIKRKWFDMIEAKIKRDEYRERKPHWESRLVKSVKDGVTTPREYDWICLHVGYGPDVPKLWLPWRGYSVSNLLYPEWCDPCEGPRPIHFVIRMRNPQREKPF